jgi:hypothetical protein
MQNSSGDMADPEKCTADACGDDRESRALEEFARDESKKQLQNDSTSNFSPDDSVGPDDNITWHYLTFETELPHPAFQIDPSSSARPYQRSPEHPDLKKYTSPFLWSRRRKHFMTWFGCVSTSITAYTAVSFQHITHI